MSILFISRSIATALDVWQLARCIAYSWVFLFAVYDGHLCLVDVGWTCERIGRCGLVAFCNLARQQAWILVHLSSTIPLYDFLLSFLDKTIMGVNSGKQHVRLSDNQGIM